MAMRQRVQEELPRPAADALTTREAQPVGVRFHAPGLPFSLTFDLAELRGLSAAPAASGRARLTRLAVLFSPAPATGALQKEAE